MAGSRTAVQRKVLIAAVVASFMAILDGFVINLALPALTRELGGGLAVQQWVVDAYLLTLGALILVAGSLSDHFGRVRVIQWGLAGFVVTSVLCGIARSPEFLIWMRCFQGVAGAMLVPGSLAMIVGSFNGRAQSAAIGTWSGWTSVAAIVAPLIGGLAVDLLSWRVVFLINVVPAAVVWPLLLTLRRLEREDEREREQLRNISVQPGTQGALRGIDVTGAALAVVALGGIVFALIEQSSAGWSNAVVWVPLVVGILASGIFLWHESRVTNPILPLSLFRVRNFGWGNAATAAIYGGFALGSFVLGLYLQQVAGMGAMQAGVALLPATILLVFLASWFGKLAGIYGPRWFMTVGPVLCGTGYLLTLTVTEPLDYWSQVLPGQLVFGLGLSATVAPLTAAILGAVPASQAGIGSAVNNAVSRIAGLVCIALAGAIIGPELTTAGLHRVLVLAATLLLAGAAASAIGIRNPPVPHQVQER